MLCGIGLFLLLIKGKASQVDIDVLQESIINNPILFTSALLLLFPNWVIEAHKWFQLLRQHVSIDAFTACKSVLAGIGLSIFTPNRIGDFGGRVLFVQKQDRPTAFYITFICSSAQLLITIVVGSFGLLYFISQLQDFLIIKAVPTVAVLVLATDMILVILFMKIERLRRIHKWLFPKMRHRIEQFPQVSALEKIKVLFWSFLRYLLFTIQFFIIMRLLGSDIAALDSFFALSLVYLFTSFLPTSIITEVPIRGSVAFFLSSALQLQAEMAAMAFVAMWIINLFIPAVFSLLLLKEMKTLKIWKPKPA